MFPISLDIDNPVFRAGLSRLFDVQTRIDAAKAQGGVLGFIKRAGWAVVGVATFARLYTLPMLRHELPADVRVAPAW